MMYLDAYNNLIVDKEDRFIMEQDRKKRYESSGDELRKQALKDFKKDWKKILNNVTINDYEKLTDLRKLRKERYPLLKTLFPSSVDTVLDKTIDRIIEKQLVKLKKDHSVVHGNDDYIKIRQKTKETGKINDISKELKTLVNKMDFKNNI